MSISNSKDVSVILFYNKPALTLRCIQSHLDAGGLDRLLLLVDNGSNPETLNAISDFIAGKANIRISSLSPNVGFGRGMNHGLAMAFNEFDANRVLLLSNDIELDPSFYTELSDISYIPEDPTIHCPQVYFLKDKSKPAYTHGNFDLQTHELSHDFDLSKSEIVFPEYYPAAATLWTRKAYEILNGFNDEYFCYWEDVELSLRSKDRVKLMPTPKLKLYHFGKGTTASKPMYKKLFETGRNLTLSKVFPPANIS